MFWLSAAYCFLWIKPGEVLAHDLLCRISFEPFCPGIPCRDSSLGIEHEDGVIPRAFHQQAKSLFAVTQGHLSLFALCNVAYHRQDGLFAAGPNRAEHDVDGKFTAVFPSPIEC